MFILVPGLCLLGIGGAPYISPQIMELKTIFSHFLAHFWGAYAIPLASSVVCRLCPP